METIAIPVRRDVWTLVFLEDGKHLLSGGREETIRQWRIEDGKEVEDQVLHASGYSQVLAIGLSDDGRWIVSGGWQAVTIWNSNTRQSVHSAREHSGWVNQVHVSPDTTRFATASDDWSTIIWNMANGRPLMEPLRHRNQVVSARFSPDGNRIATAVRDGELRIYNAHNGQLLRNIAVSLFSTNPIARSSTQHIFALCSRNILKHIAVDTSTSLAEWTIPGQPQTDNYGSIALSSNGRFIACFVGHSLTFWDACTRAQFGPVLDHPQTPYLYSIALSPDNNHVAVAGWGGIITLYNLNHTIPASHRVGVNAAGPPQIGNEDADLGPQIAAPRGTLDAPEPRLDRPRAPMTPPHIPDEIYRIKSNTGDLYLARVQDGTGTVVVQPLNRSDASQRWTVYLVANGAYNITAMGNSDVSLSVSTSNALVTGQRGTSWNVDFRGHVCVSVVMSFSPI
ncbi:WD40-repeat-containing domain protein [Boletus edulis BED1]|uniref:WD40-repeat-containing domain protein n=1 Tax=Boletus edulis BED1 TaxID=1328754 RepID=A0AAD4G7V6_BOLED|nr:WD40-repeat-containing domain protein [Boletus edulis BED1]